MNFQYLNVSCERSSFFKGSLSWPSVYWLIGDLFANALEEKHRLSEQLLAEGKRTHTTLGQICDSTTERLHTYTTDQRIKTKSLSGPFCLLPEQNSVLRASAEQVQQQLNTQQASLLKDAQQTGFDIQENSFIILLWKDSWVQPMCVWMPCCSALNFRE